MKNYMNLAQSGLEKGPNKLLPVLFLSGLKDKLIPPVMMRTNYEELCKWYTHYNLPPSWVRIETFDKGGHNDTPIKGGAQFWRVLKQWRETYTKPRETTILEESTSWYCLDIIFNIVFLWIDIIAGWRCSIFLWSLLFIESAMGTFLNHGLITKFEIFNIFDIFEMKFWS